MCAGLPNEGAGPELPIAHGGGTDIYCEKDGSAGSCDSCPARAALEIREGEMKRSLLIGLLSFLVALHAGCGNCDVVAASIFSVTPSPIPAQDAGLVITVHGSGFGPSSQVVWDGVVLTTVFVSSTEVTATVPATQLAHPGTVVVSVFNPPAGGTTVTGGIAFVGVSCQGETSNGVSVTVAP